MPLTRSARPRPEPPAPGTVRDHDPGRPWRRRRQGRGPRRRRLHALDAAVARRDAAMFTAINRDKRSLRLDLKSARGTRALPRAWWSARTSCSRASGRGSWTGSASGMAGAARSATRGWWSAASQVLARMGQIACAPAMTSTTWPAPARSRITGTADRRPGHPRRADGRHRRRRAERGASPSSRRCGAPTDRRGQPLRRVDGRRHAQLDVAAHRRRRAGQRCRARRDAAQRRAPLLPRVSLRRRLDERRSAGAEVLGAAVRAARRRRPPRLRVRHRRRRGTRRRRRLEGRARRRRGRNGASTSAARTCCCEPVLSHRRGASRCRRCAIAPRTPAVQPAWFPLRVGDARPCPDRSGARRTAPTAARCSPRWASMTPSTRGSSTSG